MIHEVRQGKTAEAFRVTFRYEMAGEAGVRTHLLGGAASEVFLGKSPRVRQAEGDDCKVYDYWMPQLVVRRQGTVPLTSTFVAVHEPFNRQPFLHDVRRLPLEPADGGVDLEVRHGEYTDTIVNKGDEPPWTERRLPGGLTVAGRLAVVHEKAGRVVAAWLIDGARVAKDDFTLTLEKPRYEGMIEAALRKADGATADSFTTAVALPAGDKLVGQWLIVTHGNGYTHGYEISSVEQRDGQSVALLREDHGLRLTRGQTEAVYFPRRKITGLNRFVIVGRTAASRVE